MERQITVTINAVDNATPALLAIKAVLDGIQSKTVTVTVNQSQGTVVASSGGDGRNYGGWDGGADPVGPNDGGGYTGEAGGGGFFDGGAGFATGLPYVPYDNFPARLHKAERVLAAAARS
jgi:hypothetical protein